MFSLKVELRKKQKKDGTCPLSVRITKDGKSAHSYLGQNIKPDQWDEGNQRVKKNHPNAAIINYLINKTKSEFNELIVECQTKNINVSASFIRGQFKSSGGSTFFAVADQYLDSLKLSKNYNTYSGDVARYRYFKAFRKDIDIRFDELDIAFVNKFVVYQKQNLEIGQRSIMNNISFIRSVFGYAIKNNIIERADSPFGKGKFIIKYPESTKIGLEKEEIMALENLCLEKGSLAAHAKNLWMLSFYFAGMRISDLYRLRWSNINDGRVYYQMGKNRKTLNIPIDERAARIIQEYAQLEPDTDDLIFSELRDIMKTNDEFEIKRVIKYKISALDKVLRNQVAPMAGIKKTVTMHIARHSFANMAGDAIPIQQLQKLYNHNSILTTINYQKNFMNKELDGALQKVLSY